MTLDDISRLRHLLGDCGPVYRKGHPTTMALGSAMAEHAVFLINAAERQIRSAVPLIVPVESPLV